MTLNTKKISKIKIKQNKSNINKDILFLTLCEGRDDGDLSAKVKKTKDQLLGGFVGDWTSKLIKYRCPIRHCSGGERCMHAAKTNCCYLLCMALFSRRIVIPSLNRWWKFLPVCRQVLLGVALHGIWADAAPNRVSARGQAQHQQAQDNVQWYDDWHRIHGSRVRKTWEYLTHPDTACVLIVILRCMMPAHRVMSWLMEHESDKRRTSTTAGDKVKSKLQVAIDWVTPSLSPLWGALALGVDMLSRVPERLTWASAFAYNAGTDFALRMRILTNMLPVLARIWWKGLMVAKSAPLVLIRVLHEGEHKRQQILGNFVATKDCCIRSGIKPLHVDCARDVDAGHDVMPTFCKVVNEFAHQVDFSNFDQELNHSSMRSTLQATNGKSMGFDVASMLHMGKEIASYHSYMTAPEAPRRQGRPANKRAAKRKRFDAWNAFVQMNQPRRDGQNRIKDGSHMKSLGQQWQRMSLEERSPYAEIAKAESAGRRAEELPQMDENDEESPAAFGGLWGLGDNQHVLRHWLHCSVQ